MVSTAIVWDHRGQAKNKESVLEVRVTVNRKVYYVSTGIKTFPREWKYGRIIDRADAEELNERLALIAKAVEREINKCIEEQREINIADIRKRVWNVREEIDDLTPFLDWYEAQLETLRIARGTLKHYKTTLRRLRACNIFRRWEDVTVENIYRFDAWLHTLSKSRSDADEKMGSAEAPIGDSGVFTYHKNLKAMISRAVKFGLMSANPYDRLKGEFKKGVKENVEYLTEDEIDAFMRLHPMDGTSMAVSRDLFVFQLFTGLSYSDAQNFDASNYKQVNGKWVTVTERVKTGVPYISQLLPPAVEILEKYNWKIPRIFNGEYNQCLKALGLAAGIQTKLHSHLARHTFATWMLRNGVKIENLARMMGHTKLEQTMRYAKVLAQSVHEDFDMIAQRLENKKGDR